MKRFLLLCCLALHAAALAAQGNLEVIALQHRSAEQVIPVLRPLLDAGGALSGQGYQLFVRTSARNLADLKRMLEAIDTPQRRLMISVRFETLAESAGGGTEVRAGARAGQAQVDARVISSRSASDERVDQRLQVLEGARAFISTGHSRPLPQRQVFSGPAGTVVQDSTLIQALDTGFEVLPRVSGSTVFLDIVPRREVPGSLGAGSVQSQLASSSIHTQFGEWVEVGGAVESSSRSGNEAAGRAGTGVGSRGAAGGELSSREARVGETRRIWVKVEEMRP